MDGILVYFGACRKLGGSDGALDAKTGRQLWRYDRKQKSHESLRRRIASIGA